MPVTHLGKNTGIVVRDTVKTSIKRNSNCEMTCPLIYDEGNPRGKEYFFLFQDTLFSANLFRCYGVQVRTNAFEP